jgi:uncharacterized protein YdeI (YjbR/CyaY-like superfamily)
MAATKPDLPVIAFPDADEWDQWLAKSHATAPGLWMKIAKKSAPSPTLGYAAALDVALTWGWIDGQKDSFDEHHWLQKFTRRGARSGWSKVNREHVARLDAAGRMKAPGEAEVERAKRDGRWEAAYDSPSRATVPDDLARELAKHKRAAALFAELDSANRYAILYRVHTAKKPETRARRIEQLVAMLAKGDTLHPRRRARATPKAPAPRSSARPKKSPSGR